MAQAGEEPISLLNDWRQGDAALIPVEIPYLDLGEDGEHIVSGIVADHGVVLLTQSCDIIRDVAEKPTVQVAVLVQATEQQLERARLGHTPGHIFLPALAPRSLIVELDSAATVHKAVVATWPRTAGCTSDEEQRQFATAVARHRQRFAFPDAFNDLVKPIRRWFEDKVGKNSPAGRCADAAREVRVSVDDWDSPTRLTFLVLIGGFPPTEAKDWQKELDALAARRKHPDFPPFDFRIVGFDDISAAEYLTSDRLDWDGLSDA